MSMNTTAIMRRVRRIEIATRRLVNNYLSGAYHSAFKGGGLEFDEVREYQPGDDVKSIAWKVTAREGRPFIKRYVEERELTVYLLFDLSPSSAFGTAERSKRETAVELAASILLSAQANRDKVGALLFSDRVEKLVPPRKDKAHVLHIIRELLFRRAEGQGTDLAAALHYLNSVQRRRAIVFILSDFWCGDFSRELGVTARRHDTVAVHLLDRCEEALPARGVVRFFDPESGETALVDTSSAVVRREFTRRALSRRDDLRVLCRSRDVDRIEVYAGEDYLAAMQYFFKRRAHS